MFKASTIGLTVKERSAWAASLGRGLIFPALILVVAFLGYYAVQSPTPWRAEHHVYLADAILHGTLDVAKVGIPSFYADVISIDGSTYLPFPPGPAILLLPFVALWGTDFSEIHMTMGLGAINAVLFWYLLGLLNVSRVTKLLLVPFFAFGTVHLYAATAGTVWFYNSVAAVFFLFLALISFFKRTSPVVPAFFLGFAFLSRQQTILAAPFFLYLLLRERHPSLLTRAVFLDKQLLTRVGLFCAMLLPFVGFYFWYNVARFDGLFATGYDTLFNGYVEGGQPYNIYRVHFPDSAHFNMFDVRNIPLHLYSIFLMPPEIAHDGSLLRPSPYGMSVLLTSPPFVFAALVRRKAILKTACWLAIGLVSIPTLLYFIQGWVGFGYKYLLDYAPFLLILTAFGFEDRQSRYWTGVKVFLVAIAILANFWGRHSMNALGW
ncbi:MAG TPA: hypothetical protein VI729_01305 [Anaerolineales bacterium]|nr:hypothetical protein [Anaerolineales bacterium]